jgi:AP-1 complex subunit beta-1
VRRSVRAIGRCAIKLEGAAERCINVLLDLITTKVNYVVQEAIVVIKDIFRKYPNRYEAIIGTLCENLDTLDEPEAKASMIWIIGEYAERIDNAGELMEQFLETFADESVSVQLQLLTSTVKLFLKQPNGTQEMVQRVLQLATQGSDNPDLRDRGFVYWRLLSTDPEAAKAVVLAEKPTINDDSGQLAPDILDQLLKHLSTLASVYHRLPETFVSRVKVATQRDDDDDEEDGSSHHAAPATHSHAAPKASGGAAAAPPPKQMDLLGDIFGDPAPVASAPPATVQRAPAPAASLLDDLMGGFGAPAPAPAAPASNLPVICTAQQGKGMEVKGHLVRRSGETVYEMVISNQTQQPLSGFAIQFNKNMFSLAPGTMPAITGAFPPFPSARQHTCLLQPPSHPLLPVNPGQSVPTSFAVKFGDASQAVIQHVTVYHRST